MLRFILPFLAMVCFTPVAPFAQLLEDLNPREETMMHPSREKILKAGEDVDSNLQTSKGDATAQYSAGHYASAVIGPILLKFVVRTQLLNKHL